MSDLKIDLDEVDALTDRKDETVRDVEKAYRRYEETGALMRAQAALSDRESAASVEHYYFQLAADSTDEAEQIRYRSLSHRYDDQVQDTHTRLRAAVDDVLDAISDRDSAAETAIARIHEVSAHDGLKDGWWDNWGAKVTEIVTKVAGWISTATAVLAIAVCWIPVVGQALAGLLLVISAVSAAIEAIGDIVLAATGEKSWTEAVVGVLGAALACVGLGGSARLAARLITKQVLVREATTGLRAGADATTASRAIQDAHAAVGAFRPSDAARLVLRDPVALWESARHWLRALPEPHDGDVLFRVWGHDEATGADAWETGGSWSPRDPRILHNGRSTLGLPSTPHSRTGFNPMTDLVIGRLEHADLVQVARHALPYDGNPGGAAEYLVRGWHDSGAIHVLDDLKLVVGG